MMSAKGQSVRSIMTWGDADNQQVKLSIPELEELSTAMAQAIVERNDGIYQRQRELKEELNKLDDLRSIREMTISSN